MDIKIAHQFSKSNKADISRSNYCGCFHCMEIFSANEVVEFVDSENTALCPKCKIDSVICDEKVKFDKHFLEKMNKYWF